MRPTVAAEGKFGKRTSLSLSLSLATVIRVGFQRIQDVIIVHVALRSKPRRRVALFAKDFPSRARIFLLKLRTRLHDACVISIESIERSCAAPEIPAALERAGSRCQFSYSCSALHADIRDNGQLAYKGGAINRRLSRDSATRY